MSCILVIVVSVLSCCGRFLFGMFWGACLITLKTQNNIENPKCDKEKFFFLILHAEYIILVVQSRGIIYYAGCVNGGFFLVRIYATRYIGGGCNSFISQKRDAI